MVATKERYNAKARQSEAGGSTHKKKKSGRARAAAAQEDTNASIIVPEEEEERKQQDKARRALLAAAGNDSSAPISSKKRKRLDKYISSRLKKDERKVLLEKLALSSRQLSDRSGLLTASTLGTGRAQSGTERLEKALTKKAETGKKGRRRKGRNAELFRVTEDDEDIDLDTDGERSDEGSGRYTPPVEIHEDGPADVADPDEARQARIMAALQRFDSTPSSSTTPLAPMPALGSALARGPDGAPIAPIMRQRKKRKQSKRAPGSGTAWGRLSREEAEEKRQREQNEDEDSFDSSAESEEDEPAGQIRNGHATNGDAEEDQDIGDDDDESDEPTGSEDEEADALLQAEMRRRGLLTNEDGHAPNGEASPPKSPPWEGFPEDEDLNMGEEDEETSEDEGESSDDENRGSDADEDVPQRSRRRGIGQSTRSSGFKDWARQALGMGGQENNPNSTSAAADDSAGAEGFVLEPVGGFTQRVGDLGPKDGVARGPLGEEVAKPSELSAFAARYYEEQGVGQTSAPESSRHKVIRHVTVQRSSELQEARLCLPVVAEEERVVRTILENPITVICGETGSGKTTQVPQFLYEAGFGTAGSSDPGMIGITQPRRVAALSMAQRVGAELSLPKTKVSHQIRYDATVSPSTSIKFMTDGVLLRELAADFLLEKYSAIIIDEAHERSVNTDVLIGVLSRVARLRAQRWIERKEGARALRLIIMSATLRVSDFTENTRLFATPPPVIDIDARQHPVTVHFDRRTTHDYVEEATKKAVKIHARLPPGGILVFMTGQQEISTVCRKLERRFGRRAILEKRRARERGQQLAQQGQEEDEEVQQRKITMAAKDGDVEAEDVDLGTRNELSLDVDDGMRGNEIDIDDDALDTDSEAGGGDEGDDAADGLPDKDDSDVPMHILPLYSLLPSDQQMRVFATPPEDARLVVVATNVAETSLTIPGIKYVVDCGRAKERRYDAVSGIQSFDVSWISKASASQRSGRAGRTGPGHCYRLYSSAVFEHHFRDFSSPEILRTPVEGLVLQMKAMNIDNVANFPFPTPPDRTSIRAAETVLTHLGALQKAQTTLSGGRRGEVARVTDLGRAMMLFPVAPRFAKLLAQGNQHGCLPYVVALVAALSVTDPFLREAALHDHDAQNGDEAAEDLESLMQPESKHLKSAELRAKEERKAKHRKFVLAMGRFAQLGFGMSDTFRLLSAVGAYEYEKGATSFCVENFLRPKAMEEIHKLRAQLSTLVQANVPGCETLASPALAPPSNTQLKVLRQLIAASFVDQIAVRADLIPGAAAQLMAQGYGQIMPGAKMRSTRGVPYLALGVPGAGVAYIHASSTFFHEAPPEWVAFTELQRTSRIKDAEADADGELQRTEKVWLKMITRVNPAWLPTLGRSLCTFSKPNDMPGAARGAGGVEKDVYLTPRYGAGIDGGAPLSNGLGWELPPTKAKQRLVAGKWTTVV